MESGIDFPALVREIREAQGLTQEGLARELNVTFGTVNGWENGKHQPIPALAHRILELARECGVHEVSTRGRVLTKVRKR